MPKVTMKDFIQSDYKHTFFTHFTLKNYHKDGFLERGYVSTPHTLVSVYNRSSSYWDNSFSELEFIYEGRSYRRNWQKSWPKKTLVRLANQFAKEVFTQSENEES